jgi:O-antigen/teichoic acid export membrane protein
VQTAFTHGLGLFIFYFTSKHLLKEEFGELNWTLAIGSTLIAIASLGLDLVFVKKLASGENALEVAGIHLFHTITGGVALLAVVIFSGYVYPSFLSDHPSFNYLFLYLVIANVGNSFKLCLNGLEAYRYLAAISIVANTLKLAVIALLAFTGSFTLFNLITVYTFVSAIELLTAYFMLRVRVKIRVKPLLKLNNYRYFIMESLPQLGVVIFDSALARIDWILLGIMSTVAITAEYSFAYKVYELAKLPLLIIGPVLLTRLSRLFAADSALNERTRSELIEFFRLEMYLMMIIPVVLVTVWTPLISWLTLGKYGLNNEVSFDLLCVCIPMMCMINLLWTAAFATGQLKNIMWITIVVSVLNVILNIVLIRMMGGTGAAIAFVCSTAVQAALYYFFTARNSVLPGTVTWLPAIVCAVAAVAIARQLSINIIFTAITAFMVYTALCILSGQLRIKKVRTMLTKK